MPFQMIKGDHVLFTVYMILLNTSFWFVLHYGIAYGCRLLPKAFYLNSSIFNEKSFERHFYKSIKISKWKDRLPAMNPTLKKLKNERSPEYLEKVIMHTYYAEFGHFTIALFGFLCIVVNPSDYFWMALLSSIANFIIHIPFCFIQRYNRPRIYRVKSRMENN